MRTSRLRLSPTSSAPGSRPEAARPAASWPLAALALLALLLAPAGRCGTAAATGAQRDPELRAVVQQAIQSAQCFGNQYDSAVWYTLMEPRLRRYMSDREERLAVLRTVYCETHRPGAAVLPPGLVLAVLEVESRFDRWAVSGTGAVGLMQVMPFWPEQLGMQRSCATTWPPSTTMCAGRSGATTAACAAATIRTAS